MVTVGLTGATGHLGSVLLRALLADPEVSVVCSVARRPLRDPVAVGHGRVRHVRADLRAPAARAALEGVDLLYHLGFQLWGSRPDDMADVNIGGARNLLRAGPGAVVLASSAAVYGAWPDNPVPIEESHRCRPNPECPYAVQKLEVERLFLDAAPTVAARLAAVLGPHADPAVAASVRGYRLAVPAVRGVPQALQFLDEADAASALLAAGRALLAGTPGVGGAVVNVAPPDWLTAEELAAVAGSRVLGLPRRLLLSAAQAGRRVGLAPFGADRAVLLSGPLALAQRRAASLLGWEAARTSDRVLEAALAR